MQRLMLGTSHWLALLCRGLGGLCLVLMLAITVADVVTRYAQRLSDGALSLQVFGSVEMVSYLMLFALLATMAAAVEKSQVVVEAFSHRLPASITARLHGGYLLGFALLGAVLASGLVGAAHSATEYGEVTQDLRLPLGPIYLTAAVLSAVMGLRSLLEGMLAMITGRGGEVSHGD
ncbi:MULTISPECIES: TRAP transporter small permease [unclassified Halomonas]|uniref:TRAP transporter small permease n=1 Tax=unclassified Halomonas TaxID=2609666 RepID=UPI001C94E438|nr:MULTISPECIES: TRAP transporter small permease subunit [unclassified Halomonas]MBY5924880.1 TRAP transporter small permease subunit [Halomonas sp. DP4Y7-2]MBY6231922.1 TRAP transporter small permease subunit [Halomonas sp. DP4Y7-1]